MVMKKNIVSHINNLFLSILLIFLHLGCFFSCSSSSSSSKNNNNNNNYLLTRNKKRKSSPKKLISSSWSFIKKVFGPKNTSVVYQTGPLTPSSTTGGSVTATTMSFCSPRVSSHDSDLHPRKKRAGSRSEFESSLYENPLLPLRNDIYPCPTCGEIFQKPSVLENHIGSKHAVSELREGDSGKNIVYIIFKTGWEIGRCHEIPNIQRILKIHNSQKILSRFEEYRETVKVKAARQNDIVLRRNDIERCIADGNELLRFHCTTFVCNLGQNGNSALCGHHYCSTCGVIRAGFSPKLDGISTLSSSWRAHVSVPGDVEADFAFMNVKRAMLVCRVIAGRVGCDPMMTEVDKADQGYDSLLGRTVTGQGSKLDDDELIVFNPRAVLPCFVIVYTV